MNEQPAASIMADLRLNRIIGNARSNISPQLKGAAGQKKRNQLVQVNAQVMPGMTCNIVQP